MEDLTLKGTEITPDIEFNSTDGYLLIKGTSIPENPYESYQPLFTVLDSYKPTTSGLTKADFLLDYFNTTSSKCILEVLKKLKALQLKGNKIEINWHYEKEDEDLLEIGQDYSNIIDIPFNLIVINSN